jgi:hypothetical protein
LLAKYNKDAFHFQHALTVEKVMKSCEADVAAALAALK